MGIFDFFKKKDKPVSKEQDVQQENDGSIKYEARVLITDVTEDQQQINEVVTKVVADDPFKRYYQGVGSKVYEYTDLTTMNVDVDNEFQLTIEGVHLGKLPQKQIDGMKAYHGKSILTVYAYVTGGNFKQYDGDDITEGFTPYNGTLYIQYT